MGECSSELVTGMRATIKEAGVWQPFLSHGYVVGCAGVTTCGCNLTQAGRYDHRDDHGAGTCLRTRRDYIAVAHTVLGQDGGSFLAKMNI